MKAPQRLSPGMKFNMLTVLAREKLNGRAAWRCVCDCGQETVAQTSKLTLGLYQSCGCNKPKSQSAAATKHGMTANGVPPEYRVWRGMKSRCLNKNVPSYLDYGGRGINISPLWVNDFKAFFDHVGTRPSDKHSIDRIDNDGNYEPGNVRWATQTEQGRNKRTTRKVLVDGKEIPLVGACREAGVKYTTAIYRLNNGWSIERALS